MENCRRFEIKKEKMWTFHPFVVDENRAKSDVFFSLSLSNTHWSRVTGCVIADGMKLSAAFNEDKGRLDD